MPICEVGVKGPFFLPALNEIFRTAMQDRELTFDEFRSQNARANAGPASTAPATKLPSDSAKIAGSSKKKVGLGIGGFLEMYEMQSFYLVVLVLDLMCLFMVLAIDAELGSAQKDDEQDEFVLTLQQIRVGLKSFHTFARYFSLVEIVTLIITFNTRVLGHVGYTLDAVIIGLQVRQAFSGGGLDGGGVVGKAILCLSFLRLWRMYRLFSTIINVEKAEHEETRIQLEERTSELATHKQELGAREEDLLKEKEARDLVELMLQDYKGRVDELNEALIIASKEILEVGRADDVDFLSDDDEDVKDYESMLDDYSQSTGHTHAHTHASGNMSAASAGARDRPDIYAMAQSGAEDTSSRPQRTFVVSSDGSFQKL